MKNTLLYLIAISTLLLASCSKEAETDKADTYPKYIVNFKKIFSKQESQSDDDARIKDSIDKYFQNIFIKKGLSGELLVARGNKVLYENYTGYSNFEKQTPLDSITPIHVASVSKVITSLVIMKLVEQDKINLKDTVQTILPDFPYKDITVQDLLDHRSGLPNYYYISDAKGNWDRSKCILNKDIPSLFEKCEENLSEPDTRFKYSNTNFALLALIAEKKLSEPFPSIVDKMIFKPLGMNHSYIYTEDKEATASLSYTKGGKLYPFNYLDLVYGDKNVYTTSQDLFKLSQAMYAKNFLRADLMDAMFTPYSNEKPGIKNYGLGFRMNVYPNGKKVTYHTGWWHGNNAIFVHLIDEKVTIIALGNKQSSLIYSAYTLISLFGDYPVKFKSDDEKHNELMINNLNL